MSLKSVFRKSYIALNQHKKRPLGSNAKRLWCKRQ